MKLIGLCGLEGSGKSTVANYLETKGYKHLSFASHLKDVVAVLYGWDRKMLEGDTSLSREWRETIDPYWNITPRKALKQTGTDFARDMISKDFWLNRISKEIKDKNYQKVVISDARFLNELKWISNSNGTLLEIQRGENPEWYDIAKEYNKDYMSDVFHPSLIDIHPTQREWIGYEHISHIITNNSTLKDLYASIDQTI